MPALQNAYFDYYGTIRDLIENKKVSLSDLKSWADIVRSMPFYYKQTINDRKCIIVHAGYIENSKMSECELQQFYLYARGEAYTEGGLQHAMIIAGHTPTVMKSQFVFNDGEVFRYVDKKKDCIFYDIDCGLAYRAKYPSGKLACIRLEDEKIFYV